ncbi:2-polyprenyl-3-methyl-6-methoxy-1,4-benzoquinone monooxygenase [Paraburkholderia caballeronis]|uniref:2-polyprenyl-3-methyl-6-methoxy-1,4-benzoquinone monooxygenase n=1 Tax=Paraburkholderia caballeronis TaxID=416943 RepID=UPI001065970F|nr:2-polyprenyl-3-methyl-6-methoxy-1,4-benzoquinone monooxygenase [Paraburkholderia caballeronis]TDV09787.1 ubiquinone biosynthesis monooxygenase Coq7 [Paraburkholderia caballeronis]TDV14032.1 ubiquinone biosynthesis monooxygenase Coq7 [Paraburkholderia caballeronis]TDV23086.1 ubiquinone biosynthesis monooxygenase Coq7 [Paraburkholderia caballeronis]
MTLDELITEFDRGLRSVTGISRMTRPMPMPTPPASEEADGEKIVAAELTPAERAHAAGLMRVNHVGEVCAQALYQAQKIATRSPALKDAFERAALEEEDHLAWTARRLQALDSRPSLLNPLWYAGALAIGFAAGRLGDKVSLGFMAETERQVERHLDSHLDSLPAGDRESRAVVEQMRVDEAAHAKSAMDLGGIELPLPVRSLMRAASKVMTRTAYRI